MEPEELKSIELFKPLNNDELVNLSKLLTSEHAKKRTIVVKELSPGDAMMFVLNGEFKVYRGTAKGKQITLAELKRGDFFGEIALLTGYPRTANVIAKTDSRILKLTRDNFIKHSEKYHGLALSLSVSLAERLRIASGRIAEFALLDLYHRLLNSLLIKAEPLEDEGCLIVRERPTQQELADFLGTSREVVTRTLKALQESGEIEIEGRTIWIYPKRD